MVCALSFGGFAGCSALNSLLGGALGEATLTIGEPTVSGLVVGSMRTVTVTAKDRTGTVESFSATSNDLNVVTMTRAKTSVTLRGVSPGTTTVDILSASGKTDYIDVQVVAGPPAVVTIVPSDAATDVPINGKISASFSSSMLVSSLNTTSFAVSTAAGVVVAGTVAYDDFTHSATFTPSANLANSTTYLVTISTLAKDASGTALESPKAWSFTTAAASVVAPTIVSVTPSDAAVGVASNGQVSVLFSIAMDPTTIGPTSLSLASNAGIAVAGAVSYDTTSRTATFTPSTALAASTMYIVSIADTIKSLEGVALAAPMTTTFTTAAPAVGAPTVLSVSPAGGATSVPVNATITAIFSTAMDPATISASSFTVAGATGIVAYDSNTMTAKFTPSNNLGYATTYTVTISTSVKDSAGTALATAKTWSFTTEAEPLVPPAVNSTAPANAAVGVSTTASISAVFSTAMDASTITAATFTLSANGTSVSGTVSYNATTMTAIFTPASPLVNSATYTAKLTTTIKDSIGTALTSVFAWSFTTAAAPPTIVSFSPLAGETGLAISTVITATFSAAMDPTSISSASFSLTGTSSVSGTVAYDAATYTATFTPAAALAMLTTYTVKISSAVKDIAGTSILADKTWTFTTAGATSFTSPGGSDIRKGKLLVNQAQPAIMTYLYISTANNLYSRDSFDQGFNWNAAIAVDTSGRVVDLAADMDSTGTAVAVWISAPAADPVGTGGTAKWSKKTQGAAMWEAQTGYPAISIYGPAGIMASPSVYRATPSDLMFTVGYDTGLNTTDGAQAVGLHWSGANGGSRVYSDPPIPYATDNPWDQQVFGSYAAGQYERAFFFSDNNPTNPDYSWSGKILAMVGSGSLDWPSGATPDPVSTLVSSASGYPSQPFMVKTNGDYALFYSLPDGYLRCRRSLDVANLWLAIENSLPTSVKPIDYMSYRSKTIYAVSDSTRYDYVVWQDTADSLKYAVVDSSSSGSPSSPVAIASNLNIDGMAYSTEGGIAVLYIAAHDSAGSTVIRVAALP